MIASGFCSAKITGRDDSETCLLEGRTHQMHNAGPVLRSREEMGLVPTALHAFEVDGRHN